MDISKITPEIILSLCAVVGMLAHYYKKSLRGEIGGTLYEYWFKDHARQSAAAVIGLVAALAAVISAGTLGGMSLSAVMALGFTTGYTADSALNQGV